MLWDLLGTTGITFRIAPPAPATERPVASRPWAQAICVRRLLFSWRIAPAMRLGLYQAGTQTYLQRTHPGWRTLAAVMPQSSIVGKLVSETVWERQRGAVCRYDRISWFRSNPFSAAPWSHCCIAPHVCAAAPGGRPLGCPGECGSRGSSPVCGANFPGAHVARDWSRSALPLVPRLAAHHT